MAAEEWAEAAAEAARAREVPEEAEADPVAKVCGEQEEADPGRAEVREAEAREDRELGREAEGQAEVAARAEVGGLAADRAGEDLVAEVVRVAGRVEVAGRVLEGAAVSAVEREQVPAGAEDLAAGAVPVQVEELAGVEPD